MKKLDAVFLIGIIGAVVFSNFSGVTGTVSKLEKDVLRMHILANSDSVEDQSVKLKVRDKLLECSEEIFGENFSLEDMKKNAGEKLEAINKIAEEVLSENGFSYGSNAEFVNMEFDARKYGELTMPAGNYDAVRITLGEAKGHNWWCVMYPPLCIPAAQEAVSDEERAEEYFDGSEMDMLENPGDYEIRFRCVDIYKSFKEKIKKIF